MFIGRRAVPAGISVDFRAVQSHRAHPEQAHLARQLQHPHDELPDQTPNHPTCDEAEQLSFAGSLSARELTYCFLGLGNLDSGAFERLERYNAALWKQTAQTLLLLGPSRCR
jgi:hypothetical protein